MCFLRRRKEPLPFFTRCSRDALPMNPYLVFLAFITYNIPHFYPKVKRQCGALGRKLFTDRCANMAHGVGPAANHWYTAIYAQRKAPRLREGLGWRISNLANYITVARGLYLLLRFNYSPLLRLRPSAAQSAYSAFWGSLPRGRNA